MPEIEENKKISQIHEMKLCRYRAHEGAPTLLKLNDPLTYEPHTRRRGKENARFSVVKKMFPGLLLLMFDCSVAFYYLVSSRER
jgi:hypothetical protein